VSVGSGGGGGGPLQAPPSPMITIKGNEIIIESELDMDTPYTFIYKGEQYVARRVNRNVIEIYRVLE
jgi:hypothetical protein